MFFDKIETAYGETLFVPNDIGEVIFTFAITIFLFCAMVFIQKTGEKVTARKLGLCTFAISTATLLSAITIYALPTGGNITPFSMLVIALPGYWFGTGAGIMAGIVYGIFQIIIDPYIISFPQAIVDYVLAFGVLGLSGLFYKKENGLLKGYFIGILGRYLFAVISGWIFFGDYAWEGWRALPYSICYNAVYIFSEGCITAFIIMFPPVKKFMGKIKFLANTNTEELNELGEE